MFPPSLKTIILMGVFPQQRICTAHGKCFLGFSRVKRNVSIVVSPYHKYGNTLYRIGVIIGNRVVCPSLDYVYKVAW